MKKSILLSNRAEHCASLAEYAENWRVLLDTLPYPVMVVGTDFHVVMLNNAAKNLMGQPDISLNSECFRLLHNIDNHIPDCPMVRTLKSGMSEQAEIYEPHLGKFLLVNTSPVIIDDRMEGVIHTILDITSQKENERGSDELIEIYAGSINELKSRETGAQRGREAFLNMLEDISESYKDLEELFLKLILVMVNALDAKSPWTKGHSERVSLYAEQIAKELLIDADEIKDIKLAGLLHDIGKIGTYDYLLDKPGRLTREEFEIVKKHPEQGADILREIKQLREIIPYIKYHHEKLDGNGYPLKLKGKEIPLGARILHVADSFDSMTSDRPYRPAPGIEYALSEMKKFKGTQFDHNVVEAFMKVLENSDEWDTDSYSE